PRAAMVLMKVMVMLRFTSPLKSNVQKLLMLPPGEHPRVKSPNLKLSSSSSSMLMPNDACNKGNEKS
ncbi:hypothetical protein CDAR_390081, partial [Caerostris darwini]